MENVTELVDPALVAAAENAKNFQVGLGIVVVTAVAVGVGGTLLTQKIRHARAAKKADNVVELHAAN